jgi:hypothetical protein
MLEVGNSEGLPRSVAEFGICLFRANINWLFDGTGRASQELSTPNEVLSARALMNIQFPWLKSSNLLPLNHDKGPMLKRRVGRGCSLQRVTRPPSASLPGHPWHRQDTLLCLRMLPYRRWRIPFPRGTRQTSRRCPLEFYQAINWREKWNDGITIFTIVLGRRIVKLGLHSIQNVERSNIVCHVEKSTAILLFRDIQFVLNILGISGTIFFFFFCIHRQMCCNKFILTKLFRQVKISAVRWEFWLRESNQRLRILFVVQLSIRERSSGSP